MDKTIENKLFTEFEIGAAALCLDYVMEVVVNNWEHLSPKSPKCRKVYKPKRVAKLTGAFDDVALPINIKGHYGIAQEISDNLDSCINDNDRERYICSILQVFEKWAKAFTPISEMQTCESTLKKHREGLAFQTEEEIRTALDRIKGMHDRLLEIMDNAKEGSIEAHFHRWYHVYYDFCNMFAAICAEHGINLLEIQNRRGIWLVDKLDVMQMQFYFGYDGNYNYANSLLKALPRTSATEALILTEKDGVINSEAAWNNSKIDAPQEANAETKKRGKKVGNFIDNLIVDEKEKDVVIEKLRLLIAGRKGKDVALIIHSCVKLGWLIKPSFSQVKNKFGCEIGNKSGYNKYANNPSLFTDQEIDGMIAKLKNL